VTEMCKLVKTKTEIKRYIMSYTMYKQQLPSD